MLHVQPSAGTHFDRSGRSLGAGRWNGQPLVRQPQRHYLPCRPPFRCGGLPSELGLP
jgi:hypothetical protein